MKMYGIPNCDTVKKARAALEKNKLEYEFIDFKKSPPTKEQILKWKEAFEEWPVNKKGPTFRKHAEAFEAASDAQKIKLLIEFSSMVKRPILEVSAKKTLFGFDPELYLQI